MIKKLCNDIMKLSSYDVIERDYSLICFLFFIKEYKLYEKKYIEKKEFCKYLYRFYLDNVEFERKHFYKIINNLHKYSPRDLYAYCEDILNYIESKSQIIWTDDTRFGLTTTLKDTTEADINVLNQVINLIIKKSINSSLIYTSELSKDDYLNYKDSAKLFNRVLEKINYCFICEEDNLNNLTIIRLNNSGEEVIYDIDNYLIMCKNEANLYEKGELIIKKNGYPYLNGRRMYSHLEISVLKNIRKYLVDNN